MPAARPASLRDRKKQDLRHRIVESAMALAAERGIDGITADDISKRAEIGRATYFRYFDSKEAAIIVGFYEQRLTALVEVLGAAPPKLGPMEAVIWTFRELGSRSDQQLKLVRLHARMVTTSTALRAKAYEFQSRYEAAIAAAIAGRFPDPKPGDLRPRLLATAALAVTQACIEHWAQQRRAQDLPALVISALQQLQSGFTGKSL